MDLKRYPRYIEAQIDRVIHILTGELIFLQGTTENDSAFVLLSRAEERTAKSRLSITLFILNENIVIDKQVPGVHIELIPGWMVEDILP